MSYLDKPCYVRMRTSEIIPGKLFLGPMPKSMRDPPQGTTHILCCMANASPPKDMHEHIVYKSVPALDEPGFPISQYFPETCAFLANAMATAAVIFVHCQVAVSRSPIVVASFLVLHHGISSADAIRFLKVKRRCVKPNAGFVKQLVEWEMCCQ